jgi:hypothetical protein
MGDDPQIRVQRRGNAARHGRCSLRCCWTKRNSQAWGLIKPGIVIDTAHFAIAGLSRQTPSDRMKKPAALVRLHKLQNASEP